MIDLAKLYCKIHPYQLITNFCKKQNCLIGLCATCVCNHTQQHVKLSTIPQYQNIRTTFTQMHNIVRQCIDLLQNDKQRIYDLKLTIDHKNSSIKESIQNARKSCLEMVNTYFDNYMKQVQQIVKDQSAKNGYHDIYKFDSLSSLLTKEISSLITCSQELNSISFLDTTKRIKKQLLKEVKNIHLQFSKELEENQHFQPSIESNSQAFHQLLNSLKKMMIVSFKYPGLRNLHKLTQIPTQKSIIDNSSVGEKGRQKTNESKIQTVVRTLQPSQVLSFSNGTGGFPRTNSSLVVQQRTFSPIKNNSLIIAQNNSNIQNRHINFMYSPSPKPVISFTRDSYSADNRSSYTESLNSTMSSNMQPKNNFMLNNSNLNQFNNNISQIQKKNRMNFQQNYVDISNQKNTLKQSNLLNQTKQKESSNMIKRRTSSKKGINICIQNELGSVKSKQNLQVDSSFYSTNEFNQNQKLGNFRF